MNNGITADGWPVESLLGRLSEQARKTLLAAGRRRLCPARQAILRQGEPGDHVVLLVAGFVRVVAIADVGGEALLAIRAGGDLVGEMAALDGKPRSATVWTCTPAEVRTIGRSELDRVTEEFPEVATGISRMLSARLRWANRRRVDFTARPAPTRVGRVLAELALAYGRPAEDGLDLGVSLTQRQLASLAGVSGSTAETELRKLEKIGVVRWGYRSVLVRDVERLRRRAEIAEENPH
ncbi:Crp/Fnr family transcriptional regulator [Solihabitans fulvus]|uniref:Crp/Fnr family transcriptional regulator n=1 Tax=Solihabitans fulvus TaxID=1892852 RepID=UPI001661D0D6|nr:Crp/Fnr family transcriptional regulator [Solihabitans fulvus]